MLHFHPTKKQTNKYVSRPQQEFGVACIPNFTTNLSFEKNKNKSKNILFLQIIKKNCGPKTNKNINVLLSKYKFIFYFLNYVIFAIELEYQIDLI